MSSCPMEVMGGRVLVWMVATLKNENGKPVSSSKFIEVHFRDGKVVAVGNEFGLGRR